MKKCTACEKFYDDDMRFCEVCGSELQKETIPVKKASTSVASDDDELSLIEFICEKIGAFFAFILSFLIDKPKRINTLDYETKKKTFVPERLDLSDGEILIKQYYCARERLAILGIRLHHFIQVTNKRIVYSKIGNSFFGPKETTTEVPISDISNLSIERGFKFNLLSLIFGGLQILPALILVFPAFFMASLLCKIDGMGITATLIGIAVFALSLFNFQLVVKEKKFKLRDVFYYTSFGIMFCVSKFVKTVANAPSDSIGESSKTFVKTIFTKRHILINTELYQTILTILSIIAFLIMLRGYIEIIRCLVKKYYHIKVGSKSGQSCPIDTQGKENLAFNGDILESFIPVVPVADARLMERELNAMIMDIQQLGDYGIEKWKEK